MTKAEACKAAFQLHHDGALAGDPSSQLKLGQLYLAGHGCAMNTNQARIWLQRAPNQGNADADEELRVLAMTITNASQVG